MSAAHGICRAARGPVVAALRRCCRELGVEALVVLSRGAWALCPLVDAMGGDLEAEDLSSAGLCVYHRSRSRTTTCSVFGGHPPKMQWVLLHGDLWTACGRRNRLRPQ